jgi:uncharacterized protein YbjT (DUF2867 family)
MSTTTPTPTYFVATATGKQGFSAALSLLSNGASVHALVRDPQAPSAHALKNAGAALFKGTPLDPSSLSTAMSGCTGVFLNTFLEFTGSDTQVEQALNIIAASLASGTVKTIVASTVIIVPRHTEFLAKDPAYPLQGFYAPKFEIEKSVRESGIQNYTILRPGWFMSNYQAPVSLFNYPELTTERLLAVSYPPGTKMGHVDPADVGKFASVVLSSPERFRGKEIELAKENLTIADVASMLSEAAGVEVKTKFRSEEETKKEVEEGRFGGLWYQLLMKDVPGVYDVDIESVESWGVKLTSLREFYEREGERKALKETLGA